MDKKFKNKFNLMVEQAVERFQQGGYINGDYVKFVSNIKSSEFFKTQSKEIQEKIQSMIDGDLHIRVSAIKSGRFPQNRVDGGLNAATDFFVDVVVEYAPGLYKDPVTVPVELIELVDTPDAMGRMPPPDSTVYKANIHGAEELTSDDENRSNPKKDTKIAGGNKWVDAPGGGGGDGMKPIRENKDDAVALTEAYESIYKKKVIKEDFSDDSFQFRDSEFESGVEIIPFEGYLNVEGVGEKYLIGRLEIATETEGGRFNPRTRERIGSPDVIFDNNSEAQDEIAAKAVLAEFETQF